MARSQDYWRLQIELNEKITNDIRKDRRDALLNLITLKEAWFNGLITVYFGLGGALIAVGANTKFSDLNHAILFWISTGMLIINGLYVTLQRKIHIEDDMNSSQTMAFEIEYHVTKAMLMAGDAFSGRLIDDKEYDKQRKKIISVINQAKNDLDKNSKGIEIASDISVSALIISLYLLTLSLVHISPKLLNYYFTLGAILAILILWLGLNSYEKAKRTTKEQMKWQKKMQNLRQG